MYTDTQCTFFDVLPPEIILHILSFLDIPDLTSLSHVSGSLASLASDPALHKNRIWVIAPSRVQHSLFGQGPHGIALRPTIADLVHRGVIRGLGIERRWRDGVYLYSHRSISQYETSIQLARRHAAHVISTQLRRRGRVSDDKVLLKTLHQLHVFPDVESSSMLVSRTLLPVMRKLKWSFQRDRLAKKIRDGTMYSIPSAPGVESIGARAVFGKWLESRGRGIVQDGERVRLAVCPDVRQKVGFWEEIRQLQ